MNIIKMKARSSEGRKKKTQAGPHQVFDCFTMGCAFGRRKGIRWKKTGRRNFCAFFSLFWSHFLRERPHYETHGGQGRLGISQGSSNTCVRPAQGTGSRPGLSGTLFSAPVRLIKPHEVVYFYVSNSPGVTLHISKSSRALTPEIPHTARQIPLFGPQRVMVVGADD